MQITKFDKANAKTLHAEMIAALAPIAAKYGLTVVQGGGTIGPIETKLNALFKVADAGAVTDAKRVEFVKYCRLFDLHPSHFGATFTSAGRHFTVCGLAISRSKRPVEAKDEAGKVYVFGTEVARLLPKIPESEEAA